jgi:ADP-ribosylglycohydrolase
VTSIIKGALREDEGGPVPGAGNEAAARAAPVGLWNWRHPEAILADSRTQARLTHGDPRAAVGAAIVAQGIASCLRREKMDTLTFLEDIVPDRTAEGSEDFISYLLQVPEWLRMREELALPDMARAGLEGSFGTSVSSFVLPSVLVSLYAFLRCPDDFPGSLAIAYRAGGDINCTGAIAGALSGARVGIEAIPYHLVRGLSATEKLQEVALALHEATTTR